MSVTRKEFVAEALSWEGTPFHHQARLKGVGCDCLGLVIGVCRQLGIPVEDQTNYRRFEQGDALAQELLRQTQGRVKLEDILPGDIIHYKWENELSPERTQHVAIYIGDGLIIHADGSLNIKRVQKARIEFAYNATVVGVYRLGLEDD